MDIEDLNQMASEELSAHLSQCCGSRQWVRLLVRNRPYRDLMDLVEKSNQIWYSLDFSDWKEAFADHPRIGNKEKLRDKYSQHLEWSGDEQKSVSEATEQTLSDLAEKNRQYEEKFGYIFIVFATGKTAKQMLELLEDRLGNDPEEEILIAGREQNKITRLRLQKLTTDNT